MVKGKLFNNDCMNVLATFKDECVDLIVTDPPYRITAKGNNLLKGSFMDEKETQKGKIFKHNDISIKTYAPELFRVLKDGGHFYIMTNHINLIEMLNVCTGCGFKFIKSLIWDKGNKLLGTYYMSQYEYILFFRKGFGKKINNCNTPDILKVSNKKTKGTDGKNLHDTQKPVELFKILIENSTQPDEIVLDPFLGIGTTALACIETGRKYVGIEIDKKYFSIAKERIDAANQW